MTDNSALAPHSDPIELQEEQEKQSLRAQLVEDFLHGMPPEFGAAARELEYYKVFESHLRLANSVLGKRALVTELAPKTDVLSIDRSLKEIAELRVFLSSNETPNFSGIDDIGSTLRKVEISGSTIYIEEGARVLRAVRSMRVLREYYSRRSKDAPTLWQTAVHLTDDRILEMHFDSVYDDAGNIKDSASSELAKIRRDIVQTAENLRNRLSAILRKLTADELVQEDLITQREGRFVVPVKAEHKRKVPGLIHSVSQTGQTVFIEPSETLDLNNELRSLEFAEQREIDRILRQLADLLRSAVPALQQSLVAAGHLDAVLAKSRYAEKIEGNPVAVEPQVSRRDRRIYLVNARHPLLLEKIGKDKTVPMTIELDEIRRTLVLTGPNAGGKTVLLKTLGLFALMAQAGIPLPVAPDCTMPAMDGVFVEIGDSQSLSEDLSTFSSHVRSLAIILRNATRESLVLLDEIGGGTAPEEGGAIAEAVLESLTTMTTFTIATTHYGRLAAFAEAVKGAANGSMEFDRETLSPTFRFRPGVPGSSHAFDIAERFGLPKHIVKRGRELVGGDTNRLEDLVKSLEDMQREARERKQDAERELGKARIARVEFERKRDEVEDIRKTAKAKASQEAETILRDANSFIERAVREAKEAAKQEIEAKHRPGDRPKADGRDLKDIRRSQEGDRQDLLGRVEKLKSASAPSPKSQEAKELQLGSKVSLRSNPGQVGEVISIKDKDVEVQIGAMRIRAKRDQLEVVSGAEARQKEKENRRQVSVATQFLAGQVERRIDLRGMFGDDAVIEVERFLSDANAHGLDRVEIIHGHGTGALGRRIVDHLRGHPLVASFRYGEPQEGGAGVTIVDLK